MDLTALQANVAAGDYLFSRHADHERCADHLTVAQVKTAILQGQLLETYPDTGRGESCLILGFAEGTPIHVVCGESGDKVVVITVYIPAPPKFIDPWTRRKADD